MAINYFCADGGEYHRIGRLTGRAARVHHHRLLPAATGCSMEVTRRQRLHHNNFIPKMMPQVLVVQGAPPR